MRKSALDVTCIIALVLFSVLTVIYGLYLQKRMMLYDTELQSTQKALVEFQKMIAASATREELFELNKKFDYAGNIQGKQQEQIDRLTLSR